MGSEFDEVAKAVAKNMPRRKIFKLFAGGLAAAIGTTVAGGSTSANSDWFDFSQFFCEPVLNATTDGAGTPNYLPGLLGDGNNFAQELECAINGIESFSLWAMFRNNGF